MTLYSWKLATSLEKMQTMMQLKHLLIILFSLQISIAQFPTECMETDPLIARECCPLYDGSKCGSDDGRGRCENITLPKDRSSVRDAWPYYFDRLCICAHNFSGYDCGRCKYGHYGVNCNSSKVFDRRPLSKYSPQDWKEYVTILASTKTHHSGYSVFLNEPQSPSSNPSQLPSSPIMLYDLFVWQHHYAAKDNDNNEPALKKDYAHESPGFLTWHRQFLLWFEWEIQYMLKSRGEKEYFTFRIPYWDWRKDQQTDENSPFQLNRLGETVNNNGLPEVHGNTYSEFLNNWETVCWKKTKFNTSNICNPQVSTGQLQRCPLMEESCGSKNKLWPNDNEVQTALSMEIYDTSPYNRTAANSFRNQLEGFKPLSNDDLRSCRENKLCTCDFKNFNCTESNDGIQPANPTQRILHNSIHIILGLGYFGSEAHSKKTKQGVMADVKASANDPIFLNHHAMVDCIFETWLQNNPNAQYPVDNKIPQGHQKLDYIVPFFPLYKHGEMFSTADKFGYQCTIKLHQKNKKTTTILTVLGVIALVLLILHVVLGIACFATWRYCKGNN